jgi:hypothetical protein
MHDTSPLESCSAAELNGKSELNLKINPYQLEPSPVKWQINVQFLNSSSLACTKIAKLSRNDLLIEYFLCKTLLVSL